MLPGQPDRCLGPLQGWASCPPELLARCFRACEWQDRRALQAVCTSWRAVLLPVGARLPAGEAPWGRVTIPLASLWPRFGDPEGTGDQSDCLRRLEPPCRYQ